MTGLLDSWTALPNLHAALIHFPVALVFTGLALELLSLLLARRTWIERAAAALYALAGAGALAAYLAGRQAADTLGSIPAQAEIVLARHADFAVWATIVLLVAAALRVAASVRGAPFPAARFGPLRAVAVVLMLFAASLVVLTADLGGALVFRHGVAVASPAGSTQNARPTPPASTPADPVAARLQRGADGSLDWRPAPSDLTAIGTILTPDPPDAPVTAIPQDPDSSTGLAIQVDGRVLLVLPGAFDNLAVAASLDLSSFQGTVGLAHHAISPETAVLFTVSSRGEARLLRRVRGKEKVFDSSSVEIMNGPVQIRTSAAGHHFKGFVGDRLIVHGHGTSTDGERVGLYLDGTGTIRLLAMTVRPADAW